MSVAQSRAVLRAKLEALECHFTWELDFSRSKLLLLRDKLMDIGTEEGYSWLGHIYNLQGYILYTLGSRDHTMGSSTDDALRSFSMAAEAFRQIRNTVSDEGPWLLVNHGNLAWLHYYLGEQVESRAYVVKVEALLQEYPSPTQGELHPEVYAEKAWTLMKFKEKRLEAIEYFQKAMRMDPDRVEWHTSHADRVEWHTSHVVTLQSAFKYCNPKKEAEILEKLRIAREHDPDNLYLTGIYLRRLAKSGKVTEAEARELARRVLKKPVSSYSGLRPLLHLYRMCLSLDEAIDLAEEALDRHPDERYLKRCLASCYEWKIFSEKDGVLRQSLIGRAIALFEEVISLYSHSLLKAKLVLANLYAESTHHDTALASQIYEELLVRNLEPAESQMLYNSYAKFLNFHLQDRYRSIDYHMKAAEIPQPSKHRNNSIKILRQIKDRGRNRMCAEIACLLANLQDWEPTT